MYTHYNDGIDEFECIWLACSIHSDKVLILDIDANEQGWCSFHLIETE